MIRLEEKYEEAVQFRKRGFTYSEIAKICGISKSTVSNWLSKKAFSKRVRADNTRRAARDNVKRISLINKARSAERKNRYSEAEHSAETEYAHYKKDALFIAGIMAYISGGDIKDNSRIRITSPDPSVHCIFIRCALTYLGVEKSDIHLWLILYSGMNEKRSMTMWSKQTGVSIAQFYKTQFIQQKMRKGALQHGTGNTIIGNTVLKKKLLRWVELLKKELR